MKIHPLQIKDLDPPFRRLGYKGIRLGTDLHLDLLVEDKVIVDLKAKETLSSIDKPKLLTYLRLSDNHKLSC